jgi:transposase InsO family protein
VNQADRDAREGLGNYFSFYNNRRYHQSLGYKTPYEVHYEDTAIIEGLRK